MERTSIRQYFIPITAMHFEIPLSNKWVITKGVKLAFQLQRQRLVYSEKPVDHVDNTNIHQTKKKLNMWDMTASIG